MQWGSDPSLSVSVGLVFSPPSSLGNSSWPLEFSSCSRTSCLWRNKAFTRVSPVSLIFLAPPERRVWAGNFRYFLPVLDRRFFVSCTRHVVVVGGDSSSSFADRSVCVRNVEEKRRFREGAPETQVNPILLMESVWMRMSSSCSTGCVRLLLLRLGGGGKVRWDLA